MTSGTVGLWLSDTEVGIGIADSETGIRHMGRLDDWAPNTYRFVPASPRRRYRMAKGKKRRKAKHGERQNVAALICAEVAAGKTDAQIRRAHPTFKSLKRVLSRARKHPKWRGKQ